MLRQQSRWLTNYSWLLPERTETLNMKRNRRKFFFLILAKSFIFKACTLLFQLPELYRGGVITSRVIRNDELINFRRLHGFPEPVTQARVKLA